MRLLSRVRPKGATLAELAGAAGLRWTIEECFERGKSDLGLDHCEARSWHGWHRHMTLVMAAGAFLAKLAAEFAALGSQQSERKESSEAAPLEPVQAPHSIGARDQDPTGAARLPASLVRAFVFGWSLWRRVHQAHAAEAHYRARNGTKMQL